MKNSNPAATADKTKKTTFKTEYTEKEKLGALLLEREEWRQCEVLDYRAFLLSDRARAHLLKYGSIGREIMHRGERRNDHSIQVYFGYRRALVAEFRPFGQNNDEDPNGSWMLFELRWKSDEGRKVARWNIDDFIESDEDEDAPVYIDTFYTDVEGADIA